MGCVVRFDTICTIKKNVKNTHVEVLPLVELQAKACNFTTSNTPPWFFFKLRLCYTLIYNELDIYVFMYLYLCVYVSYFCDHWLHI